MNKEEILKFQEEAIENFKQIREDLGEDEPEYDLFAEGYLQAVEQIIKTFFK